MNHAASEYFCWSSYMSPGFKFMGSVYTLQADSQYRPYAAGIKWSLNKNNENKRVHNYKIMLSVINDSSAEERVNMTSYLFF